MRIRLPPACQRNKGSADLQRRSILKAIFLAGGVMPLGYPVSAARLLTDGQRRPFTLDDAFNRADVADAVGSPSGERWALVITRPASAPGMQGFDIAQGGSAQGRGQIWVADARLDEVTRVTGDESWDWNPVFSPNGHCLAFFSCFDGKRTYLTVVDTGRSPKRLTETPPCELEVVFQPTMPGAAMAGSEDLPRDKFAWINDHEILYVADLTKIFPPAMVASALPETRNDVWARAMRGGGTVRIWNLQSATCGVSNQLILVDTETGGYKSLFSGDVRGVSLSPDRRSAAILVADRHLGSEEYRKSSSPTSIGIFVDRLVRLSLHIVDLGTGSSISVPDYASAGGASGRNLPVWAPDSSYFSVRMQDKYDHAKALYSVVGVGKDGRVLSRTSAKSELDAEVIVELRILSSSASPNAPRISARPRLYDAVGKFRWPGPTSYIRRYKDVLLAFDGRQTHVIGPDGNAVLGADHQAPRPPARLADGSLRAIGSDTKGLFRWSFDEHGERIDRISGEKTDFARFAVAPTGNMLCYQDTDAGTLFWTIGDRLDRRRSQFSINRYMKDIEAPKSTRIAYTTSRGEPRSGMLISPTVVTKSPAPVILTAYPGSRPKEGGAYAAINTEYAKWEPFQYLLSKGYAIFWVDFPNDTRDLLPTERVLSEVLPCTELLRKHPDVDGSKLGFFGHSNAGFAALTLEAHTDAFAAIVAMSTFPDRRAYELIPYPAFSMLDCGGFLLQENRFYAEDINLPYGLGGSFWDMPEAYDKTSPIRYLDKATTPILLIEGEFDANPAEMQYAYGVLQAHGVDAELAYYPGEPHVFYNPANIRDAWNRTESWFNKHLQSDR